MTKKHYEAIAKVINNQMEQGAFHASLDGLIEDLIQVFKQDNPRFDGERFRKACNG